MKDLEKAVVEHYGNRTRIRVNGLAFRDGQLLMIKHLGIGEKGHLWIPPGGGLEFGESVHQGLKREFLEEAGLECKVKDFLFVFEYLRPPFHAIELFFEVQIPDSPVRKGEDPEMKEQIIEEVRFMSEEELYQTPPEEMHNVFTICKSFEELLKLNGYVLFPK